MIKSKTSFREKMPIENDKFLFLHDKSVKKKQVMHCYTAFRDHGEINNKMPIGLPFSIRSTSEIT